MTSRNGRPPEKEVYQYDAPWPVYAMDWCKATTADGYRLALGSFMEDHANKLQIVTRSDLMDDRRDYFDPTRQDFLPLAEVDSYYPITKVLWEPRKSRDSDILVTSSDCLRVWELQDSPTRYDNSITSRRPYREPLQTLSKRAELLNTKQSDFCAPLTSFDWNVLDPSLIVTASIDTTCTVWNVETGQAKTQLIAHDRDVYDVAFMHGTSDIFASVGADGSVRMFDLRALEHSTILYEAPPVAATPSSSNFTSIISDGAQPLLRLQFNRINHGLLATFSMDSDTVQILDIRSPSTPVAELKNNHKNNVNCFNWSPVNGSQICTGGDDAQVFVWDITQNSENLHNGNRRHPAHGPILRYEAESEINSLCWNQTLPRWIAVGFGRTVQALRM
ncbi:WD40 repeat-like protein [Hesseltinella vesiculosa]|uniref:WD40 repeat-like protein n=1 Tax=Hesseltinella vesiculosa TaxID=101127 RepID=A0A1X2G8V9_9FUNG|nr:WD40 repeat-like protein [Hesseltinella vesiculosa]